MKLVVNVSPHNTDLKEHQFPVTNNTLCVRDRDASTFERRRR